MYLYKLNEVSFIGICVGSKSLDRSDVSEPLRPSSH